MRDVTFAPGTRLGPYEIRAARDLPGLGEVYEARDHEQRRDVAIRVLRTDFGANPERLRRFEQDTRDAAALTHPNIVTVHNIGTDAQAAYIVSEPLEGATLRESLNRGVLPVSTVIQFALQTAHGLAAAHEKGIVHGDLKPENILIAPDGRVKILGFGLAAVTQSESALTALRGPSAASALGTLSYMSPEQVRGMPADPRSDIFTFGAILCEMLSGARAFGTDNPVDTMTAILKPELAADRDIPPVLLRIVDVCLEKDPAARVATAAEIASVLHTLWSERTPVAAAADAGAPKRRFRVWSWIVALIGLVALAAAVAPAAIIVESVWQSTLLRLSPAAPSSTTPTSPPAAQPAPTPVPSTPPPAVKPAPPPVAAPPPAVTPIPAPPRSAAPPPVAAVRPARPSPAPAPRRDPPKPGPSGPSRLIWVDRTGTEAGALGEVADYGEIALSPDGMRVAVSIREPGASEADIWIIDAGSGARMRLTSSPLHDMAPVWSPDGSRVAFASVRGNSFDIYEMASDGTGDEGAVLAAPGDQIAYDWTSSGGFLLYQTDRPGTAQGAHLDLWARKLPGGRAFAFLRTVHRAFLPSSSPDGRWVAFALRENGDPVEDVHVARFPKYNGRRRVSAGGGAWPRWRGNTIFYIDSEHRLVSVSVNADGAQVKAGAASRVSPLAVKSGWGYPYDVSEDGQRILVNTVREAP